jgi:hypothetical protein
MVLNNSEAPAVPKLVSLAAGTVPDDKLEALRVVNPEPLPVITPLTPKVPVIEVPVDIQD